MRKFVLLCCTFLLGLTAIAQNRTITGKVVDRDNNKIANASIQIKGTNTGTSANADGQFTLTIPATAKILVVSAVGYADREITLTNNNNYTVQIDPAVSNLEEVVVIGYGTARKADVTGSIASVKAPDIENRPFSSVDRVLQGKVAGLQSVSPNGLPGGNQQILIRGVSSITASTQPLWVIDGVPVNSGDVSRLAITNGTNLLSTLNPNDIEDITVLKDAASQSIYGSRAANGVILVTTKKGRSGKMRFRFDSEVGQSDIAYVNDRYRPLNAQEYLDLTREGLTNLGATTAQINSTLTSLGLGNGIDFDWYNSTARKGTQQQYNLSAEGGNEKTSFFVSAGRFIQDGTTINSRMTRNSGNIRINSKPTDRISFGVNLNGGVVSGRSPLNGGSFGNPVLSSYFQLPTRSAYNADGTFNISNLGGLHNTVFLSEVDKRFNRQVSLRGSLTGEYKILDNLRFKTAYGVDYNTFEEDQYNNPLHGDGLASNGRAFGYYTRYFNWVWTNTLDYKQKITKNGDLSANVQLGYESQKSDGYFISVQSQDFPPTTALIYPSAGARPTTASATITEYTFLSQFASTSVNYKNKYVASGSFRRDGSSRFGANNRYGNFWSVGATWNVDKEKFMEKIDFISQLKLRSSYGVNGNAGIGNYDALPLYGFGFNYNQQPGSAPTNVGDPNLTWELNKPFNVGIDIGLLKNKITITADYYIRKSENLLLDVPLSRTSGFGTATRNIGAMENRGIEFAISAAVMQKRNFKWDVDFNFANNKNIVTSLPGGADILSGAFVIRQGASINSFFQRIYAGVDPTNGNPLWYTDGTRKTTTNVYPPAAARALVGQSLPKYFGSLTNSLTFKNFVVTAQFYYNFGNQVYNTWGSYQLGAGFGATFNKVARILDRWQKPGDQTDIPRYVYNGNNNFQLASTAWMNNGDFIRLRDIQVGYNVDKKLLEKFGFTSANFYIRGTNLWTWVKDKDLPFDPEQGTTSSTNLNVFIPKTITVGLNIAF
ncbi:MAG: TonB-dependent receptor [Sediminibacterium sp. Gen4]|jgi:TonB-dependent starch-binding outer membrane protein SusC|uniref:SusC/RagA family TonB-linked outer membrane protein n=1 Tax=unclassified Sediminibacterium TaxID=2635961 RepID=UPI0015BFDFE3|nr:MULTISPECIES: TonB-dependent receptor [unclassified Sediminibacterium]MBW0161585.1 TonB-dependent receptor [Sediminibacterium sp.]MBW0163290.1 TonB-dependent receptor [Sediminibacterium sp.]NWK66187.1 TonB-dependent receptor [Sediminibacterium sp. Gen4]